MRIVELPYQLCPGGAFALAAMVARNDEMQVGFTVWIADAYDFAGDVPPESYQLLATVNRFAQRAVVMTDYIADTNTLDLEVKLNVALAEVGGEPQMLDAQTITNGLANELLVFVGNEIMSVIGMTLTAVGCYALQVARGRFGTKIESHGAGEEVYVIYKSALQPLTHAAFLPGIEVALKIPLASGKFVEDLADVEAITHTFTGSGLAFPPANLRINLELRNPTFVAGLDVRFDWSIPDQRRLITSALNLRVRTLVEIVGAGDVVLWSKLTYQQHMKITGAKLATILGAETEFTARLSTDILGPEFRIVSEPITLHAIQS